MKILITIALSLVSLSPLYAQQDKDIAIFGKVEKNDLTMKECDFDKTAEAMVLFDVAELYCGIFGGNVMMDVERHVRIKILKDKGLTNADIHIPYHSYGGDESVRNILAQTYNMDAAGNMTTAKLDKKLVYTKQLNKQYSEAVFTFPEAKAGSVIEYKYKLTNAGIINWYFQKDIPVKFSRYKTDFPVEIELHSSPLCILPYQSKSEVKGNRNISSFFMKDIPALRDEPYISCDQDYLQRLESRAIALNLPTERISLTRTWPVIIKELMENEDFGLQLKRDIPRTTDLDAQLTKISTPYDKMVTIHNYVRKNMEWNGYTSIWAFDGVKSAWKDKKGTNGEINLILVNLLRDAGLTARPILVSTRENGRVNPGIPNTGQFNKVLAYVTIDQKVYVLDATEKYTPSRLLPLDVMTSEGLVIEKPETFQWGWKTIWDAKQVFKDIVVLSSEINEEGIMEGSASVTSYDYSRVQRVPHLKTGKNDLLTKFFTSSSQGCITDSLELENEESDSLPLVQKVKFSMPVNSSGNYKYFPINLFSGLEKNPFVADNRFSDVFFGANQSYSIIAYIKIPEGYVFETLPKNMRMIMPDTSLAITRLCATENNQLMTRISIDFKRPFYSAKEYPDFKEFYKKMFDMLNEQIAIRKEI